MSASGETRLSRCWNVGRCQQVVAPRDGKRLDVAIGRGAMVIYDICRVLLQLP